VRAGQEPDGSGYMDSRLRGNDGVVKLVTPDLIRGPAVFWPSEEKEEKEEAGSRIKSGMTVGCG